MLVIQKAQRTVDVPVAKDAEKTPQHEDCMTKYNEIQMDKKLRSAQLRTENKKQNVFDNESRSDLRFRIRYMSLHDKYATKILLNGAARNQTNRDGVNKEEINKYGEDRQRW